MDITNGRHGVIEQVISRQNYVPNDLHIENDAPILLITGPNMGGKSTYMRQIALCVIMAQIGSFVPCEHANLPVFDQIFTRIGASDDLISGQSTFMAVSYTHLDVYKRQLSRRIIAIQTQVDCAVSEAIYNLIYDNIINPSISSRRIDNFICCNNIFKDKLKAQYTGKNLLEVIEDVCNAYDLGFKVVLANDKKFMFKLYKGVDRSYSQVVNPRVVFSDTYDNLLSSEYNENITELATDVLVAGEGEGLERKTLWVSTQDKYGLDRFEIYKDQRRCV